MNTILKLKHWQLFLIMAFALFVSNLSHGGHSFSYDLYAIAGGTLFFLWPLLTGLALYRMLPAGISLNFRLFIFNSLVWLSAHVIIIVRSRQGSLTAEGLEILPWLYVTYAFLHYFAFPARLLKSIEKNKEASFAEYIVDFFLIVLLPLGIWFLQPRINKSARDREHRAVPPQ